jgi:hypothetical protein
MRTGITGEPCALKGASTVRRGMDGKGTSNCHLASHLPYNDVAAYSAAIKHAVDTWRHGQLWA